MYTIIETPKFEEVSAEIWADDERLEFIGLLAIHYLTKLSLVLAVLEK
jgi:hypothetical protein